MKKILWLILILSVIITFGCGGLYSTQSFGPRSISGSTISEVVQQNGPPDVVGGNDSHMVMTYYYTEGLQVLGLFSLVKKYPLGVVIDKNGEVISQGQGNEGEAITILGPIPAPVLPVETK